MGIGLQTGVLLKTGERRSSISHAPFAPLLVMSQNLISSGQTQTRIAGWNIAPEQRRSLPVVAGCGRGPDEMKRRPRIPQIEHLAAIFRMPVKVDDALADADVFDTDPRPRGR